MIHENIRAQGRNLLVPDCTPCPSLDSRLQMATACFDRWHPLALADRIGVANKVARMLYRRTDEFAHLITVERQTMLTQAREEVLLSAAMLADDATQPEHRSFPRVLHAQFGLACNGHPATGVLVGVSVSHPVLPLYQLARFCATSLMAGNVVIVQHMDGLFASATAFDRLWHEAWGWPGLCTSVQLPDDQPYALAQDRRVTGIVMLPGTHVRN